MKIIFKQYETNETELKEITNEIKDIEFGYDNGRLVIYINSQEVFKKYIAGNDFSVSIQQ